MKFNKLIYITLVFIILSSGAYAQGGYEDLLFEEVETENPVYLPIIGVGVGVINYYGELNNDTKNLLQGKPSVRINAFQYLDEKHFVKANLYVILGTLSGMEKSYSEVTENLNFQTSINEFGFGVEYNFGHMYSGDKRIRPFLSIGGGLFNFSSKTDLEIDETNESYIYRPDGTIRNSVGNIIQRDYEYETDLRKLDLYGRGNYTQNSFSLAGDIGFDLSVSDRVVMRLATSLHYTFTDDLDNISYENEVGRIGDDLNDMYTLTYVSMNFDLFSDPKTHIIEKLFMDISGDFDYSLIADGDNDGILDLKDDCLNTPAGVEVDSLGCAFDDDFDGVPNYRDKEIASSKNAIVDEFGKEMTASSIIDGLNSDLNPVDRSEVYMIPVSMGWSKYTQTSAEEIPQKYKFIDSDGDEYISFDELMNTIDNFFDFESDLTSEDIYDLNNFFFSQ
ncbi:MAG: hypothetical protein U9R54_06190 [Bacteroidota bacterium]|nr:hypothetical protein [Bacteroidota bacterium]